MPVKINGATSGSTTLQAPTTGLDTTLTLPSASGTVLTTANVAWTSWTPTWTSLTIGNGVNAWKYIQLEKTVILTGRTILGSTSSVSGVPTLTLPIAAADGGVSLRGWGTLGDSGTATYAAMPLSTSGTNLLFFCQTTTGGYVREANTSSTVPFTWATNDFIQATVIYEAA